MPTKWELLRDHGLGLPEAWLDHPWDEDTVVKVRKKIFLFLGLENSDSISVKLTDSLELGRSVPGAVPTSYGLGKHGWTTIPIRGTDAPGVDVLRDWIEESYRAVAPKTLARQLAPSD